MECCVCGKVMEKSLYSRPLCSSECYYKKYWMDIIEEKECHVIIDGHCYFVAPEGSRRPLGHSGRRFVIQRLSDNKLTVTTNLWAQGKIPKEFLKDLPNTHIIVDEDPQVCDIDI